MVKTSVSALLGVSVAMSTVVLMLPQLRNPLIFGEKLIACPIEDASKSVQLHQQFWVPKDLDLSKAHELMTSNPYGNYVNRMKSKPGECREI